MSLLLRLVQILYLELLTMSTKFFLRAVAGFLVAVLCSVFVFSAPSPAQTSQRPVKWNPGHYIAIGPSTNSLSFLRSNSEVLTSPHVKGVMKKIYWGDLEPEMGRYDFSEIDSLLAELKKSDKHLFITVWERSFVDGCSPGTPMPGYVYSRDGGRYRAALSGGRRGCAAAMWEPWVTDRFIALTKALGARYDGDPNFDGLASAETALGTATPYDKQKYKEQMIRLLRETRRAFPNSLVLATMNYLSFSRVSHEQNLGDIAKVMQEIGGGISTPDSVPSRVTPFNRVAASYKGKVAIAPMVDSSFIDLQRDTPSAINRLNVSDLGANFLFWAPWHRSQPDYLKRTVLPAIREIETNRSRYPQLVRSCPSSLRCAS
jgi:hypothetical protein